MPVVIMTKVKSGNDANRIVFYETKHKTFYKHTLICEEERIFFIILVYKNRGVEQRLACYFDLVEVGCSIHPPATNNNTKRNEYSHIKHQAEVF